jgi:hypothetical protein
MGGSQKLAINCTALRAGKPRRARRNGVLRRLIGQDEHGRFTEGFVAQTNQVPLANLAAVLA